MTPTTIPAHRPAPSRRARVWILAGACLGSTQAGAQVVEWGNVNGGGFNVGSNWIGGVVPSADKFTRFSRTRNVNSPATYTVSFSTNPTNRNMAVTDRVTFDLNAHAYLLTQPGATIAVGAASGGTGRLTITDGVLATTHADSEASIGYGDGSGLLTISAGGQLLGPHLYAGNLSLGTLVVESGGDLVGQTMTIGRFAGVVGVAAISGAGSTAVVEQLTVGMNGTGTLNLNGGGRIESTVGSIGLFTASVGTVNVDGTNSLWTSSGGMYVGFEGQGTLNITNGGRVQNTIGDIGSDSISSGNATVVGPGSLWICSSDMIVGEAGSGSLDISAGGEVRSVDGCIAQYGGHASATVSGAGSKWTMTGDLSVGGDIGQGLNGGLGTLDIGPGGAVYASTLYIFPQCLVSLLGGTLEVTTMGHAFDSSGVFSFLGGVLHVQLVEFSIVNQGGTLAPGHSAGSTSIVGDYTQQAGGRMEIEIGGTQPATQFDTIFVNGSATLGGTLDLRLINGYVPTPAQTFPVLDAGGGITGSFANVPSGHRLPVSNASGSFVVHYGPGSPFDPTQVVLSNFGLCPADFDSDGSVDFFDYDAFVRCFEGLPCPPGKTADFDSDGAVDFFDYDSFVVAFEAGC